ncbi:MAG: hypothetical protein JSS75_05985 [Bacteroidetes bacterium]|nr:hypothetical protein [Bacteroidota bacterium]
MAAFIFFLTAGLALLLAYIGQQKKKQQQQNTATNSIPKSTPPTIQPIKTTQIASSEPVATPDLPFTVTFGGFQEVEPMVEAVGLNEWKITSPYNKSFTLYNAPKDAIEELMVHLKNRMGSWRERTVPIEMIIHKTDLRCREIDAFLAQCHKELTELKERRMKEPDWKELSELDREDEIDGIESEYFDHLILKPSAVLDTLYATRDSKSDSDEELIKFYGIETITPYLRSRAGDVEQIPASHYLRNDYELLVKKGLARKGKDIPLQDILPTLTLKEMNAIADTLAPKPFGRKQKAIDFLMQQPNLFDLLNRSISFNSLFQTLPLDPKFAQINLDDISDSWRFDSELATAIISAFDRSEMLYVDDWKKQDAEEWRKKRGLPV